jgi:hypothetical protein
MKRRLFLSMIILGAAPGAAMTSHQPVAIDPYKMAKVQLTVTYDKPGDTYSIQSDFRYQGKLYLHQVFATGVVRKGDTFYEDLTRYLNRVYDYNDIGFIIPIDQVKHAFIIAGY